MIDKDEMIYKGQITIGEKLVVSDPCYDLDTWCMGVLENVLPGKYNCYLKHDANRVSKILIIHGDYNVDEATIIEEEDVDIGVDSGQAGFYNYDYFAKYSNLKKEDEEKWEKIFYEPICNLTYYTEENPNYNKEVKEYEDKVRQLEIKLLEFEKESDEYYKIDEELFDLKLEGTPNIRQYFFVFSGGIQDKMAFVSSSGYGDGSYGCYTKKNEDGKVIAAQVIFIGENEEE